MMLALVAATAAACADTTSPDPSVTAVRNAAAAMTSATSFSFTGNVIAGTQQVHLVGRFSQPASVSESITIGSRAEDFLILGGGTAYERVAPATMWTKVTPAKATTTDPRAAFTQLAAVDSAVQAGRTYSFPLTGDAAFALVAGSASVSGTVTVTGGLISDLAYRSGSPAVWVRLSYSEMGVSAAVTPPPAGEVGP